MLTGTGTTEDAANQKTGATLQQPRTDLQQNGSVASQSGPQSTVSATQDQLVGNGLRVGNSATVVSNTTSTHVAHASPATNYSVVTWFCLFVPVLLVVIILWPRKKKQPSSVKPLTFPGAAPLTVVTVTSDASTAKPAPTPKKKKTAKRKKRR